MAQATRRRFLQLGSGAAATLAGTGVARAGELASGALSVDPVANVSVPTLAPIASALRRTLPGVLAQPLTAPRRVAIHNLHTGEKLDAVYFEGGRYLPDALRAVNTLLRDYRTGDVYPMRPQLIDVLHVLSGRLEARRPFEIISGYRSPKTNAMLHERSDGVAAHSLHMQGMATDIRLPGVDLAYVHRAALTLSAGGVGYYPSSDFVHVDVGPVRRWG